MELDSVNQAGILAEIRALFELYEAALLNNDAAALNGFFWESAEVVRYGIAEHSTGIEAIRAARANMPPVHPQRRLYNTVITVFGPNSASICTEFMTPDTTRIGRQTQTWIRFEQGWRIVAAHVSLLDPALLTLY